MWLLDQEQSARTALFDYFKYEDDSAALPFFDFREYYWGVDDGEIVYNEDKQSVLDCLAGSENIGKDAYICGFEPIENQWEGDEYIMLEVDFQSQMGVVLMILNNKFMVSI